MSDYGGDDEYEYDFEEDDDALYYTEEPVYETVGFHQTCSVFEGHSGKLRQQKILAQEIRYCKPPFRTSPFDYTTSIVMSAPTLASLHRYLTLIICFNFRMT